MIIKLKLKFKGAKNCQHTGWKLQIVAIFKIPILPNYNTYKYLVIEVVFSNVSESSG